MGRRFNPAPGHMLYRSIGIIINGLKRSQSKVCVRNTRLNRIFLDILWEEGYIRGYHIKSDRELVVLLKYNFSGNSLHKFQILSKPSCRVYLTAEDLWKLQRQRLCTFIVFTTKGMITGQKACHLNLGGEVLCSIN